VCNGARQRLFWLALEFNIKETHARDTAHFRFPLLPVVNVAAQYLVPAPDPDHRRRLRKPLDRDLEADPPDMVEIPCGVFRAGNDYRVRRAPSVSTDRT
jgi:hypothetical protein